MYVWSGYAENFMSNQQSLKCLEAINLENNRSKARIGSHQTHPGSRSLSQRTLERIIRTYVSNTSGNKTTDQKHALVRIKPTPARALSLSLSKNIGENYTYASDTSGNKTTDQKHALVRIKPTLARALSLKEHWRELYDPKPEPSPHPSSLTSNIFPKKLTNSEQPIMSTDGFDPFDSLITTGKRNKNGYKLKVFECLVCGRAFGSKEEVFDHVESCLSNNESQMQSTINNLQGKDETRNTKHETRSELEACVGTYLSGKPSDASIEVVLKLLKNIVREPENVKFRKIRLGNPEIKEAIADVPRGLDLLERVGFELKEESE
ncbi:hypothetical protein L1887_31155 [Cichorium endivia]|nr:hypothetical protein L1887_31155 [Cichorium endivia]